MKNIYTDSLDKCAPLVEVNYVKSIDSWVTSELILMIRDPNLLKHKLDLSDEPEAKPDLLKEFKKKKNELKRTVIKSKRAFTSSNLH